MSALADGFGGFLVLLLAGALAHEPWRWLGLYLGRGIDVESEVFRWVRAVATALVAGLVMRIVVFAPGALGGLDLWLRLSAFAVGIVVFTALKRNVAAGMASGMLALIAGQMVIERL